MKLTVDERKADRLFLYYYFSSREAVERILSFTSSSGVPHINLTVLRNFEVPVPPLSTQRRIASILSAYDDLIENNQRRIQLLEQAALLLYKEWFVHLRFPGHESTRITNGVPERWESSSLGKLVEIKKGKNITREMTEPGTVAVVAGGLEPAYFHSTANAKGPVVTISASGANAGYVNIYFQDVWASDCSFISAEWTNDVYYYFYLLKYRQQELFALHKGTAQPHVYPKDLQRLGIISPPARLPRYFADNVGPSFALIAKLVAQNRQIRAARDLLLPHLMSGEIAV
jgi:type I restriction enzyme S subunit